MKFPIVLPLAAVVGLLAWPGLLQTWIEGVGLVSVLAWAVLVPSFLAGILLFPAALFLKKLINFRRLGTAAALLIAIPIYFFSIQHQAKRVVDSQEAENKERAEPIIRAVLDYRKATKAYPSALDVLVHERYLEKLPKYKRGTAEYSYRYGKSSDGSDKRFLIFSSGYGGHFYIFNPESREGTVAVGEGPALDGDRLQGWRRLNGL